MYDKLVEAYPRGEQGKKYWDQLVNQIKKDGRKSSMIVLLVLAEAQTAAICYTSLLSMG